MSETAAISPPTARNHDENHARRVRRLLALAFTVVSGGLLLFAAILDPASNGLGTHSQLGLPACGWVTLIDTPCPTCGMTTAFAHAADGHLLASLAAQPLGALLALTTAIVFLISGYTALTGSRAVLMLRHLWTARTGWYIAAIVFLAWVYKVITYRGWL